MKKISLFFLTFFLPGLCFQAVFAQTPVISGQAETKTFDREGLKFSYASDWALTDRSSPDTQHLLLWKKDVSALIIVVSPRRANELVNAFSELQKDIHSQFVKGVEQSLSTPEKSAEYEFLCTNIYGANIPGAKYKGLFKNEAAEGESYTFVMGNRLMTLVYMRTVRDAKQGDTVWQGLLKSVSVNNSTDSMPGVIYNLKDDGIVNGKAKKLVKPIYPLAVRGEKLSGKVTVKVLIDETGKVISAQPAGGPPEFFKESVAAAKKSRFEPTLVCGTPTKVVGNIIYAFIAR
jgi:TonB family protein